MNFNELRNNLSQERKQRNELDRQLQVAREQLRTIQLQKARLERLGRRQSSEYLQLLSREADVQGMIPDLTGSLSALTANSFDLLTNFAAAFSQQTAIRNLQDRIPILLFPVRIETRFMPVNIPGAPPHTELWVRIYPDNIQIETHEEELTQDELLAAQAYWRENWRAGGDKGRELGAWRVLASGYGPNRAAWIIREAAGYQPINPGAKPLAPVPEGEDLLVPPQFSPYEAKLEPWSRAPRVQTLPDRFVVMGFAGEKVVVEKSGAAIPDPLIVGPNPAHLEEGEGFQEDAEELEVDAEMKWMVDFEEAVKVGMGIRIPLTGELATYAQAGFDRLLVLGVRISADEEEAQELLEGLLEKHHYSEEGFSLVPQGTDTNNTREGGGSGYSSFKLGQEESFAVELGQNQFNPDPDWKKARDGQYLAQALGIDFDVFQHIQHADGYDQRDARAMNTALWHATLGYYMEEMMQPVFSAADIRETRDFFLRYVSGRGGVPAIRIGNQPYGILATTAFSRWEVPGRRNPSTGAPTADSFEGKLYQVLMRLDQDWKKYAEEVSFAGKEGDSAKTLLDMMGLHASSAEYHQRFAVGIEQLTNLLKLQGFNAFSTEIVQYIFNQGRKILADLGYEQMAESPEIFTKLFFTAQTLLDGPLADEDPASEVSPVKPTTVQAAPEDPEPENYLEWLASRTLDEIRREDFGKDLADKKIAAPRALLYLMLRQSLMLAYFDTAFRLHISRKQVADPVRDRREKELMYVAQENPARSRLSYLYSRNQAITGNDSRTVAEFVSDKLVLANPQFQFETQALREVKESLELLQDVPTARLERAFSEHIDLCSYRLDAWQLGLVRQRLEDLRGPADDRQTGIYLGAFGWLEDLRPRTPLQDFDGEIPEELTGEGLAPLKFDPENAGYIHGPSLNHAVTGAVLRNAYISYADDENADLMAVNLSSERVRMALSLIEGVRNGQGLSELLGYRFERGLHERYGPVELDKFILPLREQFPLRANRLNKAPAGTSIEQIEARNVIDGLRMLEHVRSSGNKTYPYGLSGLPAATAAERTAIDAETDRMANLLDAVGDLAMAEGVFQVAQGNYERAGAMMKAVTEGNNPPDPEIAQTPRSGHAMTQRVCIQFETNIPAAQLNPCPGIPLTPRAKAEPGLNKWLAGLLGDPTTVGVRIIRVPNGGPEVAGEVSLQEMMIQPIDLLYLTPASLKEEMTELDERIAVAVRPGLNPGESFRIEYTAPVPGKKTIFELMPLLRAVRSMVGDARPLTAEDLVLPTDGTEDPDFPQKENPQGYDVNELALRVATAYVDLTTIKTQLAEIVAVGGPLDATRYTLVRNTLLATAYFGVQQSIPQSLSGESPALEAELLEQAAAVLELVVERTDAYEALDPGSVPVSEGIAAQVAAFVEAGKAVLGGEFKWMPTFRVGYPGELQLAVSASDQLVDNTGLTLPVDDWLHGVARVREKVRKLEQTMVMVDNFGGDPVELTPIQLPYRENDHWVAVEYPGDYVFEGDKLLVYTHYAAPFDANQLQAGLLIDEWVEVVPTKEETTGIAFHFDRPNSEPAQSMILAVSPNLNGSWSWEDLVATLTETLDMAKKRAVEPAQLDNESYAQLLPAVMVPVTKFLYSLTTNLAANVGMVNAIADINFANPDDNA